MPMVLGSMLSVFNPLHHIVMLSKVWQDKCTPFADFVSTVKEQSKHKEDIVKKESEIRLLDANTLLDGTPLTKSGLNSLRGFTDIPSSMVSFLQEREYDDEFGQVSQQRVGQT